MREIALLLFLQLLFCLSAAPQEAKPETYAGFEGKTVSKVEMSIRPAMDAASFRALLKIKPGEPYSSAAVQASVIARHNMFGRAETATFSTVLSRLDQSGAFTYAAPRLRGSAWSSLFSLSAQRSTDKIRCSPPNSAGARCRLRRPWTPSAPKK